MRALLDTHTFLWFIGGDPRLAARARQTIEDSENEILVSSASLWEIAIKTSIGKLALAQPFEIFIPQQLTDQDIGTLEIQIRHLSQVAGLPHHHRDPFDRLLVAQSLVEQLPVLSKDVAFDIYGVDRIWS